MRTWAHVYLRQPIWKMTTLKQLPKGFHFHNLKLSFLATHAQMWDNPSQGPYAREGLAGAHILFLDYLHGICQSAEGAPIEISHSVIHCITLGVGVVIFPSLHADLLEAGFELRLRIKVRTGQHIQQNRVTGQMLPLSTAGKELEFPKFCSMQRAKLGRFFLVC